MIQASGFKGKTMAVFGLARSGLASCRSLLAGGSKVMAWDDKASARETLKNEMPDVIVRDLMDEDFDDIDQLVISPGVPLTHPKPHPLVTKANKAKKEIIGDIEVFSKTRPSLPNHRVVSITGTNGKSTTTALLAHVLEACGTPMAVGGNIGIPVLDLDPVDDGGVYVFELSSFQLDLTTSLKSDVAVLLNLTADHIDRHGSFDNYANAKRHLFEMQRANDIAIISVDDEGCRSIATSLPQMVIPISVETQVLGGVYVDDGYLVSRLNDEPEKILDLLVLQHLKGSHNWQNICAVYAASIKMGLASDDIISAVKSFTGLRHRLQQVAVVDHVAFINDSKASNTGAAAMALKAYDHIHWIAGGQFKEDNLDALKDHLGFVRKAYLIGSSANEFAATLDGITPYEICETLDVALKAAAGDAKRYDKATVLLAPACASFDQYESFEHRGDHFISLVEEYAGGSKNGEQATC
jgi:UDP-N-acetylmuramoylalanine--D-glutamate ligase